MWNFTLNLASPAFPVNCHTRLLNIHNNTEELDLCDVGFLHQQLKDLVQRFCEVQGSKTEFRTKDLAPINASD